MLLENVPRRLLLEFWEKSSDQLCSFWTASTCEDMLSSLPEDTIFESGELLSRETDLPWRSSAGYLPVKTTVARATTKRAASLLIDSSWSVLASGDLLEDDLFEFFRAEFDGNQASLSWYAAMLDEIKRMCEWSLWSGLPEPINPEKSLLIVRRPDQMGRLAETLSQLLDAVVGEDSLGVFRLERNPMKVRLVDSRSEFLSAARMFS